MKIKGLIKLSANEGTKFIQKDIELDVIKTSGFIDYNGIQTQITDCKGTYESSKNNCILVKEIKKKKKKEVIDD